MNINLFMLVVFVSRTTYYARKEEDGKLS